MSNVLDMFKCDVCGNIVEMFNVGGGELVCCGKPMRLLVADSTDAAVEKHVPIIEKTANGYKVTVSSVLHPMEEKHWIQWIELIADNVSYVHFLHPGDQPVAEFCISAKEVYAREYCNLHGLWKSA